MKSNNKILIIAFIILIPCVLLSGFLTKLIFNKELSFSDIEFEDFYGRNLLPKANKANFDKKILTELIEEIEKGTYDNVTSLIIVQNDSIVFEEYFRRYHRNSEIETTIPEAVISTLIGIAIQQDKIKGIDEKILGYFPEYSYIVNYNRNKENITIANLLTMSAGFKWDGSSQKGIPDVSYKNQMYKSNDWMKFTLDLPVINVPGTQFVYNEGCIILLSGIITKATGQTAAEFAMENLFSKIGIYEIDWDFQLRGSGRISDDDLDMRAIDMALFGQLYLHNGRWNNEQIVSEEWVKLSTRKWLKANDKRDYGLHWFRYAENHQITKLLKVNDIFFARGREDQFVWIIPHLNMVVVSTANNSRNSFKSESMLWDYILPAFMKK